MKKTISLPLMALAATLLVLPACRKNKQPVIVESPQYVNMPLGQTYAHNDSFDENIEALVLEEGDFISSAPTMLAANDAQELQEFTFEQVDSHPEAHIVYFSYDSKQPRADQKEAMDNAARQIKQWHKDGKKIYCKGHSCEWHGTKAYNHALSEDRAVSTSQTLAQLAQVPTSSFKTFGVGNEEPVTHEDTKEGQAVNRRVEIYPYA